MKTIWKYRLKLGSQVVSVPHGAEVVHFAVQGGNLTMWCLIPDAMAPTQERQYLVAGTGHLVPDHSNYLGSLQQSEFVWHLFELEAERVGH